MKRDMDLVREILLAIEQSKSDPMDVIALDLPGRSAEEMSHHVMLLAQAGFIDALDVSGFGGSEWQARSLTWQGHEFLDAIRDGEVWRRTKAGAEKAGVAGVGFLWELAKAYGKQVLTERLGVDLG